MMKKNFIKAAFVAAFASIAGYGVYTSQQKVEMSDLAKANVEALAQNEDGGSSNSWSCWSQEKKGSGYWRCGNPCKYVDGASGKGTEGKCYKN